LSTQLKNRGKFALKAAVGALLIFYVLRSKMIDFGTLKSLLKSPANFVIALSFLTISSLFCTWRWLLLVKVQGLALSFQKLFSLTMIGNFFNTFMPGSVGGDLIKAWYIAGQEPQRRTKAVFTVILDRVVGLAVILFYSAITLAIYSSWIKQHLHLKVIAYSVWIYGVLAILSAIAFFRPGFWNLRPIRKTLSGISKSPRLSRITDSLLLYRKHARIVFISLLLSSASIFGQSLFYAFQGMKIGVEMELAQYFFIVPIAMVVSAIPILPGGIGTGQVAFYHLFAWMDVPNPELGATLCTLVQIYTILFNCVGALFYLKFKRHPDLSKLAQSGQLTVA
jgi:glycosyltransferase 2 family protein